MIEYHERELTCEGVSLATIAAQVGTPVYVYSRARIKDNFSRVVKAFAGLDPLVCYAVKANSNLAVLALLRDLGSGFDVVSGGELYRVMHIGADPARVTFAGAGKTEGELTFALREAGGAVEITVESAQELDVLEQLAGRHGQTARVALRINPGVDPHTHRHISTGHAGSKFGIDLDQAPALLEQAARYPHVQVKGLHFHIGSQIPTPQPMVEAVRKMLALIERARQAGVTISTLSIGGGFPVAYAEGETATPVDEFVSAMKGLLESSRLALHIEPGRCILADAGVLLTQVQFVKHSAGRRIAVTDAGMTELIRPALYDAYHAIVPVRQALSPKGTNDRRQPDSPSDELTDVAGPICESSDYLGRERSLPDVQRGDVLAVLNAGAYGATMASNYNSRPRAPEVLVEGDTFRVIRRRETWEDLLSLEVDPHAPVSGSCP